MVGNDDYYMKPATKENLWLFPFFSNIPNQSLDADAIHGSYLPATSLDSLLLPNRAVKAFHSLRVKNLGKLLLTASYLSLKQGNFGTCTLEKVRTVIENHILDITTVRL